MTIVVQRFISYYDSKIKEMQDVTYGGSLRSLKGKLVETLCEDMVRQAWHDLKGQPSRISVGRKKYYITDKVGNRYGISQDKQIYIDGHYKLSIECKAYAEVAMYKRIIVDSLLLKSMFSGLVFCLFQLESMLGGDYDKDPAHPKGSPAVTALNYFFKDLDIEIITLLDGERRVKKEIHKKEFYKPMRSERVKYALDSFTRMLAPHL